MTRRLALALLTVALCGCPTPPADSPAQAPAQDPGPQPQAEPRETESAPVPARPARPLPPARVFPALSVPVLGLAEQDSLSLDVDLASGRALCLEVDARIGAVALRRGRVHGNRGVGLFGRGWFAEVESFVAPQAGGLLVARPEGTAVFVTQGEGWASSQGAIETAVRDDDGYRLLDGEGRTLRFDGDGRLLSISPGYRVQRSADGIRLTDDEGCSAWLTLRAGRVVEARGAGFAVTYAYAEDELVRVSGSRTRTYHHTDGELTRVETDGDALSVTHDAAGRISAASRGTWIHTYGFVLRDGQTVRARLRTPAGSTDFVRTDAGWSFEGAAGSATILLDERGCRRAVLQADGTLADLRGVANVLPGGDAQHATYDEQGRLTSLEASGVREGYTYDAEGRLVTHTTPDGRTTRFSYDAAGQLVSERTPAGIVRYARDEHGRVTRVTTPTGRTWSTEWADGEVAAMDGPMGPVRYERDAAGRLQARVDATGNRVERRVEGRTLSTVARAQKGEESVDALSFGADGSLERAANATADLRFAWADGRQTRVETRAGERTVVVKIDDAPDAYTLDTPWGPYRHTYQRGRLAQLETPAGTFRFEYDANGQRTRTVFPNGVVAESRYDDLGRVVAEQVHRWDQHAPLLTLASTWNERHERALDRRDGVATAYGYDRAGRLASVKRGERATRYRYDADGNRTETRTGPYDVRTASYDERGRLVEDGGDAYAHDAAGRIVTRKHAGGVDRFAYDALGRLTRAERAGAPVVTYAYDALGRLAARTVGGETTRYVYQGERLLAELGPKRERIYVYGPGLDEPLAYTDGDGWVFLHANDLGHVLAYTDEAGERVAQAAFTPFGEPEQLPSAHPTFFAGRPYDVEARLYPMRARTYDPSLGRFLSADPSFLAGGINAYTYVENRPLDYVDPQGTWSVPGWVVRRGVLPHRSLINDWTARTRENEAVLKHGLPLLRFRTRAQLGPAKNAIVAAMPPALRGHVARALQRVTPKAEAAVDAAVDGLEYTAEFHNQITARPLTPAERAAKAAAEKRPDNSLSITPGDLLTGNVSAQQVRDFVPSFGRFTAAMHDSLWKRRGELVEGFANLLGQTPQAQLLSATRDAVDDVLAGRKTATEALESLPDELRRRTRETLAQLPGMAKGLVTGTTDMIGDARDGLIDGDPDALGRFAADAEALVAGEAIAAKVLPTGKSAPPPPLGRPVPVRPPTPKAAPPQAPASPPKATGPPRPAAQRGGILNRLDESASNGKRAADDLDGPNKTPKTEPSCFLAGTLVLTNTGRQPIETIQPGDKVLAREEVTGTQAYKRVVRLFRGSTDLVVHLRVARLDDREDAQLLRCTPEHPFWVTDQGWQPAGELTVGMRLVGSEGEPLVVSDHELRTQKADHYNFEVEDWHTYFVGETASTPAVWVHNTCEVQLRKRYDAERESGKTSQTWEEYRRNYVAERSQELGWDPAQKKYQPHEGRIGTELELRGMVDGQLERLQPVPGSKTPEWRETGGAGRTFDEIAGGIPDRFVQGQILNDKLRDALIDHFHKADVTVVQVTNMSPANQSAVRVLVNQLIRSGELPAGKSVWVVDF